MAEPNVQRPPTRLYEVRTVHGEAFHAEGDVIESGDGWFTLWADQHTLALRVPETDIRAVRQVGEDELEAQAEEFESGLRQERNALMDLLEGVRQLPESPEIMNADQPNPGDWLHGYRCGVLAAKAATRTHGAKAVTP